MHDSFGEELVFYYPVETYAMLMYSSRWRVGQEPGLMGRLMKVRILTSLLEDFPDCLYGQARTEHVERCRLSLEDWAFVEAMDLEVWMVKVRFVKREVPERHRSIVQDRLNRGHMWVIEVREMIFNRDGPMFMEDES